MYYSAPPPPPPPPQCTAIIWKHTVISNSKTKAVLSHDWSLRRRLDEMVAMTISELHDGYSVPFCGWGDSCRICEIVMRQLSYHEIDKCEGTLNMELLC